MGFWKHIVATASAICVNSCQMFASFYEKDKKNAVFEASIFKTFAVDNKSYDECVIELESLS